MVRGEGPRKHVISPKTRNIYKLTGYDGKTVKVRVAKAPGQESLVGGHQDIQGQHLQGWMEDWAVYAPHRRGLTWGPGEAQDGDMAEDLKPGESLLDQSQMGIFAAGDRPYLGDPKVVAKILRDMVEALWEEPDDPDDPEADPAAPYDRSASVVFAIQTATEILTGQDDDYAPMGKWNTGDGIGNWIRGNMNKVPKDGGSYAAVEYALSHLVLHCMDALKAQELAIETPEASAERLGRSMENWTRLMLGIPYFAPPSPPTLEPTP